MEWTPAARARGITKTYGDVVALDGVDLDVAAGHVHGLVGPNGAGKTTLLGLLLGLASPDTGRLEVVDRVSGFVDGPGLYPALTARQNLDALLALRGVPTGQRSRAGEVGEVLDRVGLLAVADDKVRGFSLGMRQRLGLAAALLARPRLLVLDEPANGLDPAGRRHVLDVLRTLTEDGAAVVLSSHHVDDLAALCAEVTILATGRVVFAGPVAKLAAESGDLDYRVVTSDPAQARCLALGVSRLRVLDGPGEDLVVRGPVASLDELVVRLVTLGVAVRELAPVVPPLEAAYLALTGSEVAS